MAVADFPIFNYYDKQRFTQFSPQDCANWYLTQAPSGKKKNALYPTMGRQHIDYLGNAVLVFDVQPRAIFKSIDFMYVVVGSTIFMVDQQFSEFPLVNTDFNKTAGTLSFSFLPVLSSEVYVMICDGTNVFVITESTKSFQTVPMENVSGMTPGVPADLVNPTYVTAFSNRFVVAGADTTQFFLTQINLGPVSGGPPAVITIENIFGNPYATPPISYVFAQESGVIRQFAVLKNNLYIFTDYTTGIWSNTPSSVFTGAGNVQFPWKKNTSYDWDYGIADPLSLDTDFGMITWLAQNRNGLVQFMSSNGQAPEKISTQAINTLLQQGVNMGQTLPFLTENANGFMYQYEDTIFYRVSAGETLNNDGTPESKSASCIEFNFDTKTWHRCIELDGTRNLILDHIFFASKHIVTVIGQTMLYEMAGNIYINETSIPTTPVTFQANPMRYEMITPIISEEDYSEFKTYYVEIDFVWGQSLLPVNYVGTPEPDVELYWSDDGGISFSPADNLEFSALGVYSWRMRWYQMGVSRNRCYNLVAISGVPIVILGAVHDITRVSGGAN